MNRKNNKQVVRLNESQVRQIVAESVKRILSEGEEEGWRSYARQAYDLAKQVYDYYHNNFERKRVDVYSIQKEIYHLDRMANLYLKTEYDKYADKWLSPQIETSADEHHGFRQIARFPELGISMDYGHFMIRKDVSNGELQTMYGGVYEEAYKDLLDYFKTL